MDSRRITLAIFGNQLSNSGFQPIYWINDPPRKLENALPAGVDDRPYIVALQQLEDYTQLTLVTSRVSSYQSSRPGALKIAVSMPRGWRIAGCKSLQEVLMRVYETFLQQCMTPRDEQAATYNFKEKMPPASLFADIVDGYTLEEAPDQPLPLSTMGSGLLVFDDSLPAVAPVKKGDSWRGFWTYVLCFALGALVWFVVSRTLFPSVFSPADADEKEKAAVVSDAEEVDDEGLPAEMTVAEEVPIDEEYELYGNDNDIVPPPDDEETVPQERRRGSATDTLPWRPEQYPQHRSNARQSEPQPKQTEPKWK